MNIAECPSCQKRFKVPHFEKTWQCKSCQVALVDPSGSAPPEAAEEESVICPSCGAKNQVAATDCQSCGAALKAKVRERKRSSKSQRSQAISDRKARSAVRKDLRKLDWLGFVLFLFLMLSVLQALIFLGFMISGKLLNNAMAAVGVLLVVLPSFVYFKAWKAVAKGVGDPFPWVLGLTIISVLLMAFQFSGYFAGLVFPMVDVSFYQVLGLRVPIGSSQAVFTVALIYCCFVTHHIQTLRRENPDAFRSERKGGIGTMEATRLDRERARRMKKLGLIVGGVLLAIGLSAGLYWKSLQPTHPDQTIQEFRTAWNASDASGLARLAGEGKEADWQRRVERRAERYSWEGAYPQLGEYVAVERSPTRQSVVFESGDGGLGVEFIWRESRWVLYGINYKGLTRD